MSGQSLIEDSITTDQLLDDIKQELIYIRAGGDLEHGVICDYTDRKHAVMIDFEEDNMTEIKKLKAKDFDSAAFKRKEFRIIIPDSQSVPRILQFLHEKGFMWGFSRTSLIEDARMRELLLDAVRCHTVTLVIESGGYISDGVIYDSNPSSSKTTIELIFEEEMSNDKIVITNDGKTTTATLYSNSKKTGIGTAICHDDDEFDIYAGAKLALERLEKNKKESEMTDWEKFINGKVNMRIPKKYIRNFLDRAEKDGVTFQGTMLDWYLRWLERDGDSILICVNSKIEKIPVLVEVIRDDNGETVDYIPGMK